MGSVLSTSQSSYHTLIANVSSLFGILVFLQEMWGAASLEQTLLTAASAGLAAYLILAVGYAAARGILRYGASSQQGEPPREPSSEHAEPPSNPTSDESATETKAQDAENVAEVQAA